MAAPTLHRTFTAAEDERMTETGILSEDERVELLGGEINAMSPIGGQHAYAVRTLTNLFVKPIGHAVIINVQNPIRLDDNSMPLPDIAVLRPRNYSSALPTPADVLLVIEVADASLAYDRGMKSPRYAAAGIPEAWLIDRVGGIVARHTEPRDGLYRQITIARGDDPLASLILPELTIAVGAVLGTSDGP
ncbi:MAG: Uma2 family endonuclease [Thermomicrobiales bacterium]